MTRSLPETLDDATDASKVLDVNLVEAPVAVAIAVDVVAVVVADVTKGDVVPSITTSSSSYCGGCNLRSKGFFKGGSRQGEDGVCGEWKGTWRGEDRGDCGGVM